jgi:hypothetical protein
LKAQCDEALPNSDFSINLRCYDKAEMPRDVVREAFQRIYGTSLATEMALTAFCGDECATLVGPRV